MSKNASKAEQYASELAGARLRGEWTSSDVLSSQIHGGSKGKAIDWPELIRKFAKHNPDKKLVADVASAEQELLSQLESFHAAKKYTDETHSNDRAFPGRIGHTAFPPVVSESDSGAGYSGQRIASVAQKLARLQQEAHSELQRSAIVPIHALALVALGRDEEAVSLLHDVKFIESVQMDELKSAAHSEDYTVALLMMGFVVYGMANERLHEEDPEAGYAPFAFAGYARAIDLHEGVRGGKAANALRGLPADEIERWGETALYRNALLSVREGDSTLGLNALRAYQAHSGRWPADFRLPQRAVMYRTYLQALNRSVEESDYFEPPKLPPKSQHDPRSQAYQFNVVQSVASRVSIRDFASERTRRDGTKLLIPGVNARAIVSRTTANRRPNKHLMLRPGSEVWTNEMLTAALLASNTVKRSSAFPRAGEANVQALELADALVRAWELDGEKGGIDADELSQTLYALTKVTFNSQRISRSLVRVLAAAELHDEAKLALELYMQLVDKSREANAADDASAGEGAKEGGQVNGQSQQVNGNGSASEANAAKKGAKAVKDSDVDDVETYLRVLAFGSRLHCKYLHAPAEADRIAQKAMHIADEDKGFAKIASKQQLSALLKRVAGGARAALAVAEGNPLTRSQKQHEALTLLKQSVQLDGDAAETYYHLAYLQAEMRDTASATASARKAVELEPASVEAWHLLTILLTTKKDYRGALKLAEVALEEAEKDDEHDRKLTTQDALQAKAGASQGSATVRTALLSYDFPPRGSERAESILRLLATHNALEEIVEGVEVAIEGQKELFSFFHERIATEASARIARAGNTVLPKSNTMTSSEQDTSSASRKHGSRLSTLLHLYGSHDGSDKASGRLGSSTGLGQSGASATVPASLTSAPSPYGSLSRSLQTALPPPPSANESAEAQNDSPESQRLRQHLKTEADILTGLWLLSAATFRRAAKLDECRVAVQEAERITPGNPDVWLQLALWFVENDNVGLATSSLYKALACSGDHVGSSVHLARIFLSNPDSIPATSHNSSAFAASANTPTPVPRPGVEHNFLDGTQSRSIGASAKAHGVSPGSKEARFESSADAAASKETKKLTALSLAEGILNTTTASSGWDVPEAWLFLGHVAQKTHRAERAAECLKFALALEETKPIRPLQIALQRSS